MPMCPSRHRSGSRNSKSSGEGDDDGGDDGKRARHRGASAQAPDSDCDDDSLLGSDAKRAARPPGAVKMGVASSKPDFGAILRNATFRK